MTPDQATEFAARILAAIDADLWNTESVRTADRERVASDLHGIQRHQQLKLRGDGATQCYTCGRWERCDDRLSYEAGLRRTGSLYGCERTK